MERRGAHTGTVCGCLTSEVPLASSRATEVRNAARMPGVQGRDRTPQGGELQVSRAPPPPPTHT